MKVIAIVGPIASGKTTVANFLIDHGYEHYKLVQAIYDECDKHKLDRKDRTVLQDIGDELRAKEGVAVLAKRTIEKIKKSSNDKFVIESIRNHNEVLELKKAFGDDMLVISTNAPIEIRHKRAVERKGQYKEQDMTFEKFKEICDRDLGVGNKENEQNVAKCIELADVEVSNEGTEEELRHKVEKIIA